MQAAFRSTGQRPDICGWRTEGWGKSSRKRGKLLWVPRQLCLPGLCSSHRISIHLDPNSPFRLEEAETYQLETPPVSCSLPTDISSAPAPSLQARRRACLCPCRKDVPPSVLRTSSATPALFQSLSPPSSKSPASHSLITAGRFLLVTPHSLQDLSSLTRD